MRFKQWLSEDLGTAIGRQDFPGQWTNAGLPVQSKYVTKNGCDRVGPDDADADGKKSPDQVFGFRSPEDNVAARKRRNQNIDTGRTGATIERIPPDTIY